MEENAGAVKFEGQPPFLSLAGGKERAGGFVRKVCRGDALFGS
jgi:hypothetical protein